MTRPAAVHRLSRVLPLLRRTLAGGALLLVPALGACDTGGHAPRLEFEGSEADEAASGDVLFRVVDREGDVELGLTDRTFFFRLSEDRRTQVEREIEAETPQDGLAGRIGSAVGGVVGSALRTRVSFDVDAVREMRWEDGRIVVDWVEGAGPTNRVEFDGQDPFSRFAEDDARAFIRAFEEVKAERGGAS